MSNVCNEEKQQQILSLGYLGWTVADPARHACLTRPRSSAGASRFFVAQCSTKRACEIALVGRRAVRLLDSRTDPLCRWNLVRSRALTNPQHVERPVPELKRRAQNGTARYQGGLVKLISSMSKEHIARIKRIRQECSALDVLQEETRLLCEAITAKARKERAASRPVPRSQRLRRKR
jgi:hypothetical protein